jgi:hypothetical protein
MHHELLTRGAVYAAAALAAPNADRSREPLQKLALTFLDALVSAHHGANYAGPASVVDADMEALLYGQAPPFLGACVVGLEQSTGHVTADWLQLFASLVIALAQGCTRTVYPDAGLINVLVGALETRSTETHDVDGRRNHQQISECALPSLLRVARESACVHQTNPACFSAALHWQDMHA